MAEIFALTRMARRAGLPAADLKGLAKVGKVPSLQVGGRFLFNPDATIAALSKLAAEASVPDEEISSQKSARHGADSTPERTQTGLGQPGSHSERSDVFQPSRINTTRGGGQPMANIEFSSTDFEPLTQAITEAIECRLKKFLSQDRDETIMVGARQAAQMLGVSVSTLDRWRNEKGLPFIKREGGRVLYRVEALREFAAAQEIRAARSEQGEVHDA